MGWLFLRYCADTDCEKTLHISAVEDDTLPQGKFFSAL